jgi:flagellar hook-basal body complex protein FliE
MITALTAARAYAQTQGAAGASSGAGGAEMLGGSAFSDMVKSAIESTVQSSRAAEAQMTAQVQGKAELIDVVTSVAAAEASLEQVIAVRDQVIAAYQEIMRMPI